ncbi:hypothetical protein F5Y16DRAFT_344853 [Xylariaceae sp. FL0255]|nr:hypothetical protein F5Y16DRAFT_344853 [Xylariaceae sp. FL0255]
MPPKRRSTGSSSQPAKKSKNTASEADEAYQPPRSKRWATVSGSGNAAGNYWARCRDPEKAFAYYTICKPWYTSRNKNQGDDDEDEEDEEDDEDDEDDELEPEEKNEDDDRPGPRCKKPGCICFKSVADNPDHPWVISLAGYVKFQNQFIQVELRDQDNYGMHVFNDFPGYGVLEVLQNLILDFKEADDDWRHQWAVCEATMPFLSHNISDPMAWLPASDDVTETTALVGRMFLSMLAKLDRLQLLSADSQVKSLACTTAQYMDLAEDLRRGDLLAGARRKKYSGKKPLQAAYFDDAILSYAVKRNITLCGPPNLQDLIANAKPEPELPLETSKDPWAFKQMLAKYEAKDYVELFRFMTGNSRAHGFDKGAHSGIGGDTLDITTWTSACRKEKSFDNKDPLPKEIIKNLKEGLVMMRG